MVEDLIRETALRFLNLLGEQSSEFKEIISNLENLEIIEECIENLTDESLRNFDDFISSFSDVEDEDFQH